MANVSDEIAHLEQLTVTLRRRIRALETQVAGYGPLAVPSHIVLELEDSAHQLKQVLADLDSRRNRQVSDRAPYLGLATFQETNSDLFFGREAVVTDLVE